MRARSVARRGFAPHTQQTYNYPVAVGNANDLEGDPRLRAMNDQLREMQLDLVAMKGALTGKQCPADFDARCLCVYVLAVAKSIVWFWLAF